MFEGAQAPGPAAARSGALLATAGSPGPHHLARARVLLEAVPAELREAIRTPEGALALVLALLLDPDPEISGAQLVRIGDALGRPAADRAAAFQPMTAEVGPWTRLPLLELALPGLRGLPRERANALHGVLGALIRADGEILPFEFALFHLVHRNLPAGPGVALHSRGTGTVPLSRLAGEAEVLLSALAHSGSAEDTHAQAAFRAGAALLPEAGSAWRLRPRDGVSLDRVDEALVRLAGASPTARRQVLEAAGAVVLSDETLQVREAEMLRAVAEALEVPIPPVLLHSTPPS